MNKKTNNFLLNLALALLMSLPAFGWAKTKVVLISGRDSHGSSAHNWGDGVDLLSNALATTVVLTFYHIFLLLSNN